MLDQAPGGCDAAGSAVRLAEAWFPVCDAREVGTRPIARVLQGVPLVLWRSSGQVAGAVDRCPHRNVPLSGGRVLPDGALECAYHGWQFDAAGACLAVPGLDPGVAVRRGCNAEAVALREQDGLVWAWATPGGAPVGEPWRFALLDDRRYLVLRRQFLVKGTLHATAENALDVPHTAFLHGGLFRTRGARCTIDVVVRRGADRVEAEYIGEPRPAGLAPRLLAPRGGTVAHVDRFVLPSIVQVEYRLGDGAHMLSTAALSPVDATTTRLFAVVALRSALPRWVVRLAAAPVMGMIFRQDAAILAAQAGAIERFGGERFVHTPADVLGRDIRRLLLRAARERDAAGVRETDGGEARVRLHL